MRRIDQSSAIARLLERFSSSLARQRGLPVVIGLFLILISFAVHLADLSAPSPTLALIWSITHHLGLIIALIGLLLIEPLGR
ncbi:MAG: hypothetical protein ACUVS2_09085 [Candidatus Flexifilum sp.]|jgi:hypothetical protein